MSEINKDRLQNELGIKVDADVTPEVKVVETVATSGEVPFKVSVTEMTVSFKVNPKNTYSPIETSMTVSIQGANAEQKRTIQTDLANQVIDYTIKTAMQAINTAKQNQLI